MEAKKTRVNVILLDCCRELITREITRSDVEHLDPDKMGALNPRAPEGTIIGFACDEYMMASDGFGSNGLYTSHLEDHLGDNLQDIETNLKLTGEDVEEDPHNRTGQKPRIKSNLTKQIFLFTDTNRDLLSEFRRIPIVPDDIAKKLLDSPKQYLPQEEAVFSRHLARLEEVLSSCEKQARKDSFDAFLARYNQSSLPKSSSSISNKKTSFALKICIDDFRIGSSSQYETVKRRVTHSLNVMLKTTKFPFRVSAAVNSWCHGSCWLSGDLTECVGDIDTDAQLALTVTAGVCLIVRVLYLAQTFEPQRVFKFFRGLCY